MKKIFLVSVICLLMMSLAASSALAVGEDYTFKLSYSPLAELKVGDVITITFSIVNNKNESYKMCAVQNEILFDREYFELIESSITPASGFASGMRNNTQNSGAVVLINFLDMTLRGVDRAANMVAGSFQLKIIKACQDIKISNKDFFIVDADSNKLPVSSEDIVISAAGPVVIKPAPSLISTAVTLGSNVVITFTDDAIWRGAIQSVYVDGEPANYTIANGSITIAGSFFPTVKNYVIRVIAEGYADAVVIQVVNPASTTVPTVPPTTPTVPPTTPTTPPTTPTTPPDTIDIGDGEVPLSLISAHIRYIYGYEDGSFGPEKNITRAEVAAMFYRLIDDTNGDMGSYKTSFSDVAEGIWYYDAVAYLEHYKILAGYPDGTFKPGDSITRAEFAKIAALFEKLSTTVTNTFPDVRDSHWAASYILSCADKGWINGFPDGTFRPDEKITRAQVVTIINRMQERSIEKADIPATALKYPDVAESHWAYADIVEASNEHTYTRKENGYELWNR